MPACDACKALDKKPSATDPHPALEIVKSSEWKAGGMGRGTVELYRCKTCGTALSRDLDKKDTHAMWEIHKAA